MNPSTRDRLRKGWGMCERHAWGWIVIESAFRSGYMHGPALLYQDIMGLALKAFRMNGPMRYGRLRKKFLQNGPCLMCEEGFGPDTQGIVRASVIEQGRDLREFQSLARRTSRYWKWAICGKCSGDSKPTRCRKHLLEDESARLHDFLTTHTALVSYIVRHLNRYARSFQFEFKGTQTVEDEAALISAVGWLSGWTLFLSIIDPGLEIA